MPNLHKGHRKRLREQFLKQGMEDFPAHKVLELLLFYAIPRQDTNELGHRLLERFGSLSGVLDAPVELLKEVEGVGESAAIYLKVVAGTMKAYLADYTSVHNCIESPEEAKEYMRYRFLSEQQECIYLACLGMNSRVLFCDRIAEGSPESVGVSPAVVVRAALRANAAKAVLAHNHPHGIAHPSSRDLQTTSVLFHELRRVEVELVDHIIVANGEVCSMQEQGMFPSGQDGMLL